VLDLTLPSHPNQVQLHSEICFDVLNDLMCSGVNPEYDASAACLNGVVAELVCAISAAAHAFLTVQTRTHTWKALSVQQSAGGFMLLVSQCIL